MQIPCDLTYIWNQDKKINEQTKLIQTHRYRTNWRLTDGSEVGGWVKKANG